MKRISILIVLAGVVWLATVGGVARADGELSGWGYMSWPYVYSSDGKAWSYIDTSTDQWVYEYGNSQWFKWGNSQLRSGWVFFDLPYAYSFANSAWCYLNESDTLWIYSYDIGQWVSKTAAAQAAKQFAGSYSGIFGGDDSGTWSVTVKPSGGVSGTVWSNYYQEHLSIYGAVYSTGGLAAGVAGTEAYWNGTIRATTGNVAGTWQDNESSGTFTGQRN